MPIHSVVSEFDLLTSLWITLYNTIPTKLGSYGMLKSMFQARVQFIYARTEQQRTRSPNIKLLKNHMTENMPSCSTYKFQMMKIVWLGSCDLIESIQFTPLFLLLVSEYYHGIHRKTSFVFSSYKRNKKTKEKSLHILSCKWNPEKPPIHYTLQDSSPMPTKYMHRGHKMDQYGSANKKTGKSLLIQLKLSQSFISLIISTKGWCWFFVC